MSPPRVGFFTDTSLCIGCKACEVACKEWNHVPEDGLNYLGNSYDHTGGLGADTWRHVAVVEQKLPLGVQHGIPKSLAQQAALESVVSSRGVDAEPDAEGLRWLMSSDVCKHCTDAGCLDVCPTGALFRTEFETVVVQEDVCNGCGTCVAGCPFGVIERRRDGTAGPKTERDFTPGEQAPARNVGVAQKCTLCYDRIVEDQTPACAQTCPTTSIKYGKREDMVA